MKKTDDRSRWEQAPINDKDVVWSFIVDNIDHPLIENPIRDEFIAYGSDGGRVIATCEDGDYISFRSDSEVAIKEIVELIADPINTDDTEEDLYADVGVLIDEGSQFAHRYYQSILFYHTDVS